MWRNASREASASPSSVGGGVVTPDSGRIYFVNDRQVLSLSTETKLATRICYSTIDMNINSYLECGPSFKRGATLWRANIGFYMMGIPQRIPFQVIPESASESYYGFTLDVDHDHRYVANDWTVFHNSGADIV